MSRWVYELESNQVWDIYYQIAVENPAFGSQDMRKQDILRRLELFPGGENLDSGVDCTLKLGPPLDETISDSKTDKAMKAPNPSNMNFFYSTSPQVMQNYGVVKGRWNAYSGWGGISSSNHFTCFLDSERCNNNSVGLNSFGGSSSVKAPTNSNALNYFGGYLGFTPRPRNNVKVNSASQRRTEPEPTGSTRRCTACDTTSTPLWRNGPKGIKTLCNACGIRYKKEERRALGIAESYSKLKSSVKGRESTKKFWF